MPVAVHRAGMSVINDPPPGLCRFESYTNPRYMNTKHFWSLASCITLTIALLSCGDDDENPSCDTFTPADSVCFCSSHPEDIACLKLPAEFTISLYTEERVTLTPHAGNGTLWSKGFVIGNTIYVIDRQSESPHAFWKFDVQANDTWEQAADFPGTSYGLIGSANGKGYASSYASNKFWEYDPTANEWTPMTDLPFSPGETHWVEYKGKFYVPNYNGIYEFNATTKEWTIFSDQASSGFGAIFLMGDDMYWWNINNDYMSRLNLATKTYEEHALPDGFNKSVVFNSPFVLGNFAYVVQYRTLWIFNPSTKTWTQDDDIITSGGSYVDDIFILDNKVFIVDDGFLRVFEPGE